MPPEPAPASPTQQPSEAPSNADQPAASPGAPQSEEARQSTSSDPGRDQAGELSAATDPAPPSPARSTQSRESGEASSGEDEPDFAPGKSAEQDPSAPPLPNEAPPLPNEQLPGPADDGWDFHWDASQQAYFFYNRFTNQTTWDNPRLANPASAAAAAPEPPRNERPPAGGYNPAIHGDYDPNAWYAKGPAEDATSAQAQVDAGAGYAAVGSFNRFTGRWQAGDANPDNHNDEAKSKRQMNAFFDVDSAANSHDGRSLKAERSGKKPSKTELKQFKEKRKAKKEEKRRAWLRD